MLHAVQNSMYSYDVKFETSVTFTFFQGMHRLPIWLDIRSSNPVLFSILPDMGSDYRSFFSIRQICSNLFLNRGQKHLGNGNMKYIMKGTVLITCKWIIAPLSGIRPHQISWRHPQLRLLHTQRSAGVQNICCCASSWHPWGQQEQALKVQKVRTERSSYTTAAAPTCAPRRAQPIYYIGLYCNHTVHCTVYIKIKWKVLNKMKWYPAQPLIIM